MRRKGGVLGLLASLVILTGCTGMGSTTLTGSCNVAGSDATITAEQNANAKAIADVALELGLGQRGAEVGIVTANVEADLVNVGYGDYSSNGQMTSSRGLFQQKEEWGPLPDRLDPAKAARMFYTGGAQGQKGLMDFPGWQTMEIGVAMQLVQQSQFAGGTSPGFAGKLAVGLRIASAVIGGNAASACSPTGPGAVIDGVNVTLPNNEFVAAAVRGKTVIAPNAGVAKGIASGLGQLGLPYVWGGSDAAGGPADSGCSRGGGSLNSCQQGLAGFDCSGLTAFVIVAGGFPGPGTNSSAQRSAGQSIPWEQGLPGDIVGFEGHVALYLGLIDGTRYILEASTVGVPVHIVKLTRADFDPVLHRYWSPSPA